jgi:hypothetical protein
MTDIEVELTPVAKAIAERDWSVESLVSKVKFELSEMLADEDGLDSLEDLMFHTVWKDGPDVAFSVVPAGGNKVLVDHTSYRVVGKPLESGPFAGLSVQMPTSVDEEDLD